MLQRFNNPVMAANFAQVTGLSKPKLASWPTKACFYHIVNGIGILKNQIVLRNR